VTLQKAQKSQQEKTASTKQGGGTYLPANYRSRISNQQGLQPTNLTDNGLGLLTGDFIRSYMKTEHSPVQIKSNNIKLPKNKHLLQSEDKLKGMREASHNKVMTATFNQDFIEKMEKEGEMNKKM
jgi:hypothetical protein